MFLLANETNKFVVVQSNELIEASYSPELTTRAHKVARLVLSLISPDDKDLKLYTVPISTLKDFLGYKENTAWGNFYPEMKDIADRLNKEPIVIKKAEKVTTAYFIAGYEIDSAARTVTFEVSLLLKPYLLALKRNFTRYPLNYIARLRSAYSIRLYELLCQYKNIGHRTFELAVLQQLLGSNYEFYANFKDKVLTIAKRDLDANTDIHFEYEEIKTARKVTALKFTISSNSVSDTEGGDTEVVVQNVVAELISAAIFSEETKQKLTKIGLKSPALKRFEQQGFGLIVDEKTREQAILRCNNNLETYFLEKIMLTEKSGKETARNKAGFFVKALQEDWQPVGATAHISEKPKTIVPNNSLDIKRLEAQIRQTKQAWDAAKQPVYDQIVSSNNADTSIMGSFLQIFDSVRDGSGSLKNTIFPANESPQEIFQKNGMAANLLKLRIEDTFKDKFVEINKTYKKTLMDLESQLIALKPV